MWDIAGITPKKKKNIWETAWQITDTPIVAPIEPPKTDVQPFSEATKWQDVQFRQSYRQALESTIKTEAPTTTSPLGLSGAELAAYNQLTPQEQKTYQALATQGVKAQTDYLAKSKASMEFAKSQEEKRTAMEDNADAIADMNSQRNIEEATKQVANLKQNIGYLGTGGQPWVSSQKLDAVSNQVTLADRTLKNIIEAERLSKENRKLGQEKNSEIFTRQIKILQDDLDSKVNKTIQSALNEFTSAELEWKLDTIPEIEAFQQQLYAQLDGDLSSIMDTNIEARKFLIERYDKLAESQKTAMQAKEKADAEALKRKNTLNKEMSQALGYYVNENGEALTDRVTGMNIVVPPESDVTYDKDSGQMVILTKNRDGTVGVQLKQVGTPTSKAPSTTVIENPDGTKSTLQWNGSSWVPLQGVQWATPTGRIVPITAGNKTIRVDQAWASGFQNAIDQLSTAWIPVVVGQGARDQAATIKSMADRLGFAYNAANPAETAAKLRAAWHAVADPGKSNHESGMAVDIYKDSSLQAVSPEQERILNANGWYSAGIPWDAGHFEYRGSTQAAAPWYTEENKIFDALYNFSGGASKVSEGEAKLMKQRAKTFTEMGLTPIQAIAKYKGFDIQKPEDAEFAQEYISVGDNLSDKIKPKSYEATVSKYINSGDYKGLNDYVNRLVDKEVQETYKTDSILSGNFNVWQQRTEKLKTLINRNKDKLGAFDGYVSDFIQKFSNNPEYQQIKTILQMSQADTRKYFAGSAVTETEMKALQDFIGWNTKMTPENLITMLDTLNEDRKMVYDSQRQWLELPDVKAATAKKKLGWFSLTDILSKLP